MYVLIAEDNADSRRLLTRQLQVAGHEVKSAANGTEALAAALERPPDIVVTDILMPGMDGFQLCMEWKLDERLKHIPLVFYTATYTSDEDERFATSLGADAFIRKPAETDEFLQRLTDVVANAATGSAQQTQYAAPDYTGFLAGYSRRLLAKLSKKVAQLETDIVERRRIEAELNLRAQLLDAARDIIYVTDMDGVLLYVNEAAGLGLGYAGDEMLGHNLREFVAQESTVPYEGVVENEGFIESEYVRKDGTRLPVEIRPRIIDWGGRRVRLAVVRDITERKAAEEELRRSAEQLHELTAYIEEAREKERTGIARELHDQIGQALTALRMDLDGVRRACINREAPPAERLDQMGQLLDEMVNDVRRISSDLRPGILDDAGLIPAIEWYLERFRERSNLECSFEPRAADAAIDRAQSTALFRVLQELLTNVARHASASRVHVIIERNNGEVVLTVTDDGRGIAESEITSPTSLGLIGIRERLRPLHGNIRFILGQPSGTTVLISVPMAH